jgi:hypothetical protein
MPETENKELGLKNGPGSPKIYAPALIAVKIYHTEQELIEVIKRAQKRGFSVLVPKNGEKPSTTGLNDYFRTIDRESDSFDKLRRKKAQEVNEIVDEFGLSSADLMDARLKK